MGVIVVPCRVQIIGGLVLHGMFKCKMTMCGTNPDKHIAEMTFHSRIGTSEG